MSTHAQVLVPVQPFTPRLASWLGHFIDAARAFRRAQAARAERRRLVLAHDLESSMPSMAADLRRAADRAF
jgi:hypothetical protein